MALSESELNAKRDALLSSIARSTRQVASGDKSVTFQSIDEMQKALSVLDAEIAKVTGTAPARITRFYTRSH